MSGFIGVSVMKMNILNVRNFLCEQWHIRNIAAYVLNENQKQWDNCWYWADFDDWMYHEFFNYLEMKNQVQQQMTVLNDMIAAINYVIYRSSGVNFK